jgi:hypothetical protein
MATPAAVPARRRPSVTPLAGWSLLLGIVYGSFAQAIARSGGPATFGQLWLALVSGAGFAVLFYLLGRFRKSLMRELRALAYGVLVGGSIGFLYSQTQHSVLLSGGIGLAFGASTVIVTFYWFFASETEMDV